MGESVRGAHTGLSGSCTSASEGRKSSGSPEKLKGVSPEWEYHPMQRQKEPCTRTPEQILDAAILQPRPLLVDANVVAYFGDLLLGIRTAVKTCSSTLGKSSRKGPRDTASVPGRS